MINFWLEKIQCTGCGACANICPKNAITMEEDECGFIYPKINENCIECGLCKKTCEKRGTVSDNSKTPKTYACWSNDEKNRNISTSGGMFFEFAKNILNDGGVVFGAIYNKNNDIVHSVATNVEELEKLRQSKYAQSDIGYTMREAKKYLLEGTKVLFAGAPCQIAGLKAYLAKDFENLLTVEFVCRGMNSRKALRSWISEIEKIEDSKVTKVWFKYKENGWNKSPTCTRLDFENGKYKVYSGNDNLYMKAYLGPNLFIRKSCSQCSFKNFPRIADVTLADFWKIEKKYDDDKGTSMVLLNSEKGIKIFENIKNNLKCFEQDFSKIFEGNVCINNSVKINKKSDKFLKSLNDTNFSKLTKKYTKKSIVRKSISFAKKVMKKVLRKG